MHTKRINRKILKIISAATAFIFVFSVVSPGSALAARSSAGGGELASFDVGKFAMTAGISVASVGISAAIGSGVNSAIQGGNTLASIGGSLSNSFMNVGGLASNYNTFAAVSQVGRAVGMAGSYHGWDPSATFIVSSVASGITAGALNPSTYVGSSLGKTVSTASLSVMGRGAVIGGVSGLASAGVVAAIDGDKINKGEQPGVGAQVAGMTAGMLAASVTRTAFDPNTRNIIKFAKVSGNDAQLKQSSGADSILKSTESVGMDSGKLTTADAAKIYHSDKTQFLGKTADGQNQFMVSDAQKPIASAGNNVSQKPIFFSLSDSQVSMMDNIRADPDGSVWAPVQGTPSSSTLAGRYMLYPIVDTFNQRDAITTSAINIAATQNMDTAWKPLAQVVINSVVGSVLDSAAMVYSLKPSLFSKVDQNLGLRPDAQIQQAELFNQARISKIAKEMEKSAVPDQTRQMVQQKILEDGFTPEQLKTMSAQEQARLVSAKLERMTSIQQTELITRKLKDINVKQDNFIPSSLLKKDGDGSIKINTEQQAQIYGVFRESVRMALVTNEERFVPKQVIFGEVNNAINTNIKPGIGKETKPSDSYKNLKGVGGSRNEVFLAALKNSMTYDLPVALISGGVQVGLTKMIDDKDQTSNMLVSLAGAAATGIARGVVWSVDNNLRYNREMAALDKGTYSPELASTHTVSDQAKIVLARVSGDLPIPDQTTYKITGQSAVNNKGEKVDMAVVKEKIQQIESDLSKLGIQAAFREDTPISTIAPTVKNELGKKIGLLTSEAISIQFPQLFESYKLALKGKKIDDASAKSINEIRLQTVKGFEEKMQTLGTALNENLSYLRQLTPIVTIEPGGNRKMAPDNTIKVSGTDLVYSSRGTAIKPGMSSYGNIRHTEAWSVDNSGDIVPYKKYTLDGASVEGPYPVVKPPGLFSTVMGSLGQSLYEYGTQSFSMGLPVIQRSNLSTYALYDYSQRVNAMAYSTLETGGLTGFMARQASEVGQNVITRNVLTTVSNTPIGSAIGMSRFRPIAGYNGMPFTVAVVVDSRFGGADQRFFSNWPTNALGVVPRDPLHNAFRSSLISRTASNYFDINQDTVPSLEKK